MYGSKGGRVGVGNRIFTVKKFLHLYWKIPKNVPLTPIYISDKPIYPKYPLNPTYRSLLENFLDPRIYI